VDDAVSGLRKSGNLFLMTWFKKNFKFQIKKINREKIPLIVPRGYMPKEWGLPEISAPQLHLPPPQIH
jgi:hypothetical protein